MRRFVATCVATFEDGFRIECVHVIVGVLDVILPLDGNAVPDPIGDQVSTFTVLQPLCFTACPQILEQFRPGHETGRFNDLPQRLVEIAV
ncbi:MAG: hypothetical protein ABGZ53_15240 [Fuerstiella sp.]